MQSIFNGDQPEHYVESFRLLKKYIEESLDMYKDELYGVLFPVFVQLFLGMVKSDFVGPAQKFFQEERYQFTVGNREELMILEQVDCPSKFAIPEVNKYLLNKFVVKMSSYAFNLLMHFVKVNQIILLLQIFN